MLDKLMPQQNTAQSQNFTTPHTLPGASKEHTVLPKNQTVQATEQSEKTQGDEYNAASDEGRKAKVEQAARSFITNMYVVSDHSLTIFKDSTGQFITRIRNLKDGRVSYYPEPDMLRMSQPYSGGSPGMVKINA